MTQLLLEWVFTSIFLILTVLALRALLGKRVSAGLKYALWTVVLVRLLVPVQLFTSPLAGTWVVTEERVENSSAQVPRVSARPGETPFLDEQDAPAPEAGPGTAPDFPDPPAVPAAPDLTKAPTWLGWLWLAGGLAMAAAFLVSNLNFALRLRRVRTRMEGADCPLPVYIAGGLPSPCLFGLFRPAVYVTAETAQDPAMFRHVLAHEYTHFRHGDHIWNVLRGAALAAHWWNPLVWLAVALSRRDCELACDEGALKRLGEGERIAYGRTLVALITEKPRPGDLLRCATTMTGGQKSVFDRVTRIAKAPKRWLWAAVALVLAAALACVCAFGQAEPPDDGDGLTPVYTMNGDRNVLIEGLGGAHVEWSRGTNGGALYLAEDLELLCPRLAGETAEGGAYWDDVGNKKFQSILIVSLNVNDDRLVDGTVNGFDIDFTVDLSSDTVTQKKFASQLGDRTIELTDREMLDTAHTLARLLTEAADYYNSHNAGEPSDLTARFAVDVENVPADVLDAIGQHVQENYEQFLDVRLGYFSWLSEDEMPQFDGWRVENLEGPYENDIRGVEVEIWRVNYEYHADDPAKAEYMLVGGMYVTEDGWLCPTYSNCTYYIFILDGQGNRRLGTVMMANDCAPDKGAAPERFYRSVEQALAMELTGMPLQADLNRNGVPEELRVMSIGGGTGEKLEVWEDGGLLFSGEGYFAHAGYNALFLCTLNGKDYLLRYNPYMGQGMCTYSYQLFTLKNGRETVAREDSVEFDINFQPMMGENHQFDVNEIVRFMNEINELLSHSVQLLNTDSDLLDTFKENGQLYDDLWWLDTWEPVYVRGEQTLADELWRFQAAMEGQWEDEREDWGLTLTAGNVTPAGLTLTFTQSGGKPTGELHYGSYYWLEREEDGVWTTVPDILEPGVNLAWTDEAYSIPMDGQTSWKEDWSWLYGELPPGHYRIYKEVTDFRAAGDYDEQVYYAEFDVK